MSVCEGLMTTRSLRDIAIDTGTTEPIVSSVLTSVEFAALDRLPQTLCIDEFKGSSGEWDPSHSRWDVNSYHCNIADGDTGCVFDILEKIDAPYLTEYFHTYSIDMRRNVRFFCCDMHGGFMTIAKNCFPNTTICVDNFHTTRLLMDNIDDIRRTLWRQYQKFSAGELREAFDAYQEFLVILHTPEYAIQRADLTDWIRNHKIKVIKRNGYGAHSFRNFRRRILFSCGHTRFVRETYTIASQQKPLKEKEVR